MDEELNENESDKLKNFYNHLQIIKDTFEKNDIRIHDRNNNKFDLFDAKKLIDYDSKVHSVSIFRKGTPVFTFIHGSEQNYTTGTNAFFQKNKKLYICFDALTFKDIRDQLKTFLSLLHRIQEFTFIDRNGEVEVVQFEIETSSPIPQYFQFQNPEPEEDMIYKESFERRKQTGNVVEIKDYTRYVCTQCFKMFYNWLDKCANCNIKNSYEIKRNQKLFRAMQQGLTKLQKSLQGFNIYIDAQSPKEHIAIALSLGKIKNDINNRQIIDITPDHVFIVQRTTTYGESHLIFFNHGYPKQIIEINTFIQRKIVQTQYYHYVVKTDFVQFFNKLSFDKVQQTIQNRKDFEFNDWNVKWEQEGHNFDIEQEIKRLLSSVQTYMKALNKHLPSDLYDYSENKVFFLIDDNWIKASPHHIRKLNLYENNERHYPSIANDDCFMILASIAILIRVVQFIKLFNSYNRLNVILQAVLVDDLLFTITDNKHVDTIGFFLEELRAWLEFTLCNSKLEYNLKKFILTNKKEDIKNLKFGNKRIEDLLKQKSDVNEYKEEGKESYKNQTFTFPYTIVNDGFRDLRKRLKGLLE